MRRLLLVLLLAFALGPAVVLADGKEAEEKPAKPRTAQDVADAILRIVTAGDPDALEALAGEDKPDPWLVADELCHRGEYDAAQAFSKAAPRVVLEKLPAYVESRRGRAPDPKPRAALAAAEQALAAKSWTVALEALPADLPLDDVVSIRIAVARGTAQRSLRRYAEGAQAFCAAGAAAQALGWIGLASKAWFEAGAIAMRAARWRQALGAFHVSRLLMKKVGDKPGLGAVLLHAGNAHAALSQHAEARAHLEEALALQESVGDAAQRAAVLWGLGHLDYRLGEYAKALVRLEAALEINRARDDRAALARTLSMKGAVHHELGQDAAALRAHRESLALAEALDDKPQISMTENNLAMVHARRGEYAEAIERYRRSLRIDEELNDGPGQAQTLNNLGIALEELGRFDEALTHYRRSLILKEALEDRRGYARTLMNIGGLLQLQGKNGEALDHHRRALQISKSVDDRASVAATLRSIGYVRENLGEYEEALARHRESLALEEALENPYGTSEAHNGIGNALHALGDAEGALEHYERSLALQERLGDRVGATMTRGNIAAVRGETGHARDALAHYERALAFFESIGDQLDIAETLENLAVAHRSLGQIPEAIAAYERALAVLERTPQPRTRARALWGLCGLRQGLAQYDQVLPLARRGVEEVMGWTRSLAEREAANARDLFAGLFDFGLLSAVHTKDAASLCWFFEQGCAGSLRETLGARDALRAAVVPPDLLARLKIAEANEQRALAAYREVGRGRRLRATRAARQAYEKAQDDVRRVIEDMQRNKRAVASLVYPAPDALAVVRGYLKPGEALVYYGLTTGPTFALVVEPERTRIVAVALFPVQVERAVAGALTDDTPWVRPEGIARLRQLLVDPLKLGDDVERVLVSPMGRLSYVPFSLLFPDREVVYVPSGTTYGLLLGEKDEHGEKILALGDPDYRTQVDEHALRIRAGKVTRLARLPATRKEVEAIADVPILGMQATESGLQDAIEGQDRWRAVHFACHGLVDPERPLLSALALTADRENDGFLTALEIFRMKIPADLVVLSACETGKGRIYKTEGILGLTRAFMFAGAPRVICSLWKVDDEATQALMIKFYELWGAKPKATSERSASNRSTGDGTRGLGAAAALKKAQAFVREHPDHPEWKHPYYWAAWVLWGLPE